MTTVNDTAPGTTKLSLEVEIQQYPATGIVDYSSSLYLYNSIKHDKMTG